MSLYSIARTNGGAIAWTDEQVAYIVDKYINENYTLKKLGDEFGCSYGTIKNLLHRKGYKSGGINKVILEMKIIFQRLIVLIRLIG